MTSLIDGSQHSRLSSFEEAKLYKESREDPSFFLWDIQLQSSDGSLVPANRFILVRESAFFDRLLSSDFLDSSSKILRVDVSTSIIQRLVSALHSDEVWMQHNIANVPHEQYCHDRPSCHI